jgi:hypothetical protein
MININETDLFMHVHVVPVHYGSAGGDPWKHRVTQVDKPEVPKLWVAIPGGRSWFSWRGGRVI